MIPVGVHRFRSPPEWLVAWAKRKFKLLSRLFERFERSYKLPGHGLVVLSRPGGILVMGVGTPLAFEVQNGFVLIMGPDRGLTGIGLSNTAGGAVVPVGLPGLASFMTFEAAETPLRYGRAHFMTLAQRLFDTGQGSALRSLLAAFSTAHGHTVSVNPIHFVADDSFLDDTDYGSALSNIGVVYSTSVFPLNTWRLDNPTVADAAVHVIPLHRLTYAPVATAVPAVDLLTISTAHDLSTALGGYNNAHLLSLNPCSPMWVSNVEFDVLSNDVVYPPIKALVNLDDPFTTARLRVGEQVTSLVHGKFTYAAGAFVFTPVGATVPGALLDTSVPSFEDISATFDQESFGVVTATSPAVRMRTGWSAGGLLNEDLPPPPIESALLPLIGTLPLTKVSGALTVNGVPTTVAVNAESVLLATLRGNFESNDLSAPFDGSEVITSLRTPAGGGTFDYAVTVGADLGWHPLPLLDELFVAALSSSGVTVHALFWRQADSVNDGVCVVTRTVAYPVARAAYEAAPTDETLAALRAEQTVVVNNCVSLEFLDVWTGSQTIIVT